MKNIIKFILLLCVFNMLCVTVNAASNDATGHIYSTDILAIIGGNEVPSYNIGGKTVVIVEDLSDDEFGYIFQSEYDDAKRLLTVSGKTPNKIDSHIARGKVGKILGDVYDTDIKVIFNGSYIKGYNIGGKTAVCLEDIGNIAGSPNEEYGYSKYAAKAVWNEADRTILLDFANNSQQQQLLLTSTVSQYIFNIEDSILSAEYDDLNLYYSKFINENFKETENDKYIIKPLYLDLSGKKEQIGISYKNADNFTEMNIFDYNYVFAKLNEYKAANKQKLTYNEILEKFNDGENFKTLYSIETEDYVLLLAKKMALENCVDYVAVNKSGDYVIIGSDGEYQETTLEKIDTNTVRVSLAPFDGPHGATTMQTEYHLDFYN